VYGQIFSTEYYGEKCTSSQVMHTHLSFTPLLLLCEPFKTHAGPQFYFLLAK